MVRPLTSGDLDGAFALSTLAGWNQTREDWARVFSLQPDLCLGIDRDGRLAATGTAVCYGHALAWIGMILTYPDHRGRGFARAIMEALLADLDARAVPTLRLDATDMGRPLYLKLGFIDEIAIERWRLPAAPRINAPPSVQNKPNFTLDRAAFGADRTQLLHMLAAGESAALGDSLAMGRPGRVAAFFGPCISQNKANARALLEWFLARHPAQSVYWDLLPANAAAVALAREYGFEPLRRLVRMRRGRPLDYRLDYAYAAAGFEYG